MGLDLTTLLVVSQLVSTVCGLLFLVEAVRGKSAPSRWFAGAFLCAPIAPFFYIAAADGPPWLWGYPVGNGIATMVMALTWIGARSVNERSEPLWIALAVPCATSAAVLLVESELDAWSGAYPFFLSFSAFGLLAALEFWRGKEGEPRLRNAVVLTAICGFDALLYSGRALALWLLGPDHPVFLGVFGPEASTIILMLLIVISSFSLIAMGKERADLLMRYAACHDGLTDLLNRREFFLRATGALKRLAREREPVAALLLDLDHFKSINDTHGHLAGDQVLVAFAGIARDNLRSGDLLCRYGGEEFAAVLPGATRQQAFDVAERIRSGFSESGHPALAPLAPTTSIGVATAPAAETELTALFERADKCLYRAKASGRNRIVLDADVFEKTPSLATAMPAEPAFGNPLAARQAARL